MQNAYENRDFYLTGYLLSKGLKLLDHRKNGPMTVFFIEKSDNIFELISDYYSMKASCEPVAFSQALRTLKSIIHSTNTNLTGMYNNGNSSNM